jgi:putative membrane protein
VERARATDGGPVTGSRFPRWVYAEGAEPDPRFTLANERTFLAWIRTALALIAGGVALEALSLPIQPGLRIAASVLLLVLGLVAPVLAWFGWAGTERALRRGRPLPSSPLGLLLAAGVAAVAVLVLVGVLVP